MRCAAIGVWAALVLTGSHSAPAPAETLHGTPAGPANPTEAVAALSKCAGRMQSDATCAALRYRVLAILSEDIVTLGASDLPADRALLARALHHPEAQLRSAAADAYGLRGPRPDEIRVLVDALNDPVPAVRRKVARAIGNSTDPKAVSALERSTAAGTSRTPEKPTDMSALGVRPYAGATYLYFSSAPDEGREEFATADPPAKVVDFYKTAAKKGPMAIAEFGRAYEAKPGLPQGLAMQGGSSGQLTAEQMAQAMAMAQQLARDMQGKTPEEAQKALIAGGAAASAPLPIARYEKADVYGSPRVIVLREAVFLGAARPSLYLVIFEDKTLGKTGIAVHSVAAP